MYIPAAGPHQAKAQKIYDELRKNIIDNVHKVNRDVFFFLVASWGLTLAGRTGIRADGLCVGAVRSFDGRGEEKPSVHGMDVAGYFE